VNENLSLLVLGWIGLYAPVALAAVGSAIGCTLAGSGNRRHGGSRQRLRALCGIVGFALFHVYLRHCRHVHPQPPGDTAKRRRFVGDWTLFRVGVSVNRDIPRYVLRLGHFRLQIQTGNFRTFSGSGCHRGGVRCVCLCICPRRRRRYCGEMTHESEMESARRTRFENGLIQNGTFA